MKSLLSNLDDFERVLKEEADKIGITLTDRKINKLVKYKEILLEWNEKMNLTAITDNYEILMKHFIDCLEIVKFIKKGSSLIDVGTGAGFPGIIISIYFEENIHITLLDSLHKRTVFLEEVVKVLDLKNISIIHGRAEEYGVKEEYREKYDYAVSRAVANLGTLLEYDSPYIKIKGQCLLMKGDNVEKEIEESKRACQILNCKIIQNYSYQYQVEKEEYHRSILVIEKSQHTPKGYPRSNGLIKKKPLQ